MNKHDTIQNEIGYGYVVDSFVIDRGHHQGAEVHKVTSTAVVLIYNMQTSQFITEIIARPEQLRRLYRTQNRDVPKWLLRLAYDHNRKKYNELKE